jgi:multicomponent Na+:H+ antiporter subunit B
MNSLILTTISRIVTPLMLAFSIYLLLRGHNQPGGGFVGGLVCAAALIMDAITNGAWAARRRLPLDPPDLAVLGIAVAIAAGVLAFAADAPFLTGVWTFPGGIALGSPLLFDLGVYLVVVGAVATLFLALEEDA